MNLPSLVLASASPRRADLLRAAGIAFDVIPADVDESIHPGERADVYVRRLAEAKAAAVAHRAPGRAILAADTVVVVDGEVLGKPRDRDDARRMLQLISGRTHQVLTGVCLRGATSHHTQVATTSVEVAVLTPAEVEWYLDTGEPMDKAGAYAIQGFASRFVSRIDGSYSNVVGLPVTVVYALLRATAW